MCETPEPCLALGHAHHHPDTDTVRWWFRFQWLVLSSLFQPFPIASSSFSSFLMCPLLQPRWGVLLPAPDTALPVLHSEDQSIPFYPDLSRPPVHRDGLSCPCSLSVCPNTNQQVMAGRHPLPC